MVADNFENLNDQEIDRLVAQKMSAETAQPGGDDYSNLNDNEIDKMVFQRMTNEGAKEKASDRPIEAASQGYGQMATLGYLPQLQAKMEPITDRLFNLFSGGDTEPAPWEQLTSNKEDYTQSRDANIKRIEGLKESNPYSYYGGAGAGMVNLAALGPGAAGVRGMQTAYRAKLAAQQAAVIGGVYGVLSNPGDAEGVVDELQLSPRLRNAVLGSILGFGAQKGLDKVAKHSKTIAKKIINIAKKKYAKRAVTDQAALGQDKLVSGTIRPTKGKEVLQVLKEGADDVRQTPQTREANRAYKELGLEELSPIQLQQKAGADPTPAQYAEGLLKVKDPKLYNKQLQQFKSLESKLDVYKGKGDINPETFGAKVNKELKEGLKETGEIIGKFKKDISGTRVSVGDVPKPKIKNLLEYKIKDPYSDQAVSLADRIKGLRNFKSLDDLASDIGTAKQQRFLANGNQGDRGTRALGEYKKQLEKHIETYFPEGKPREMYKTYAKVKNIYNDTLKGVLKTGGDVKVLRNVTKTAENFRQFKDVAETLKRPDIVTSVRENYISELFNGRNWVSTIKKAQRTQAYNEIIPAATKKKMALLIKYKEQYASTTATGVNPPRSGMVGAMVEFAKQPKTKIIEMLVGDERKYTKALSLYNKLVESDKKPAKEYLKKIGESINKIAGVTEVISDHPLAYQALIAKYVKEKTTFKPDEIKGKNMWMLKGLGKLEGVNLSDPENIKKLLYNNKGERLLIDLSGAKKNTKRIESVKKRINDYLNEGI